MFGYHNMGKNASQMIRRKIQLKMRWMAQDVFHAFGHKVSLEPLKGQVRVLCLHGICRDDQSFINARFLHEQQLEELLSALHRKVNFINLKQYLDADFC